MGNYPTKLFSQNDKSESTIDVNSIITEQKPTEPNNQFTPVTTRTKLLTDPRSLTAEIVRTPIEINLTSPITFKSTLSAIPKHLQTAQFRNDIDLAISSTTSRRDLDPRSPNVNQPRTPIIIQNIMSYGTPIINSESNSKILTTNNVSYTILGVDPRSPTTDFDRTPILMSKSITTKVQESLNKNSFEVDISDSFYGEHKSMPSNISKAEALNTAKILDDSNYTDAESDVEVNNALDDLKRNIESISIEDNMEHRACVSDNDDVNVAEDAVIEKQTKADNQEISLEKKCTQNVKKKIEVICDDGAVEIDKKAQPEKGVNECDSKIIHALKEKEIFKENVMTMHEKNFASCNINVNDTPKKRAPLTNRSINSQLEVTRGKSPQRKKGLNTKIQQENTPPHRKNNIKNRMNDGQWDPQSTMII